VRTDLRAESVVLFLRHNTHSFEYGLARVGQENGYDVFKVDFIVDRESTYFYRFEIKSCGKTIYCGKGEGGAAVIGEWLPEWQLSVYQSRYKTADFIKGGVVYHIFCDRFCKAGTNPKPSYGVEKGWDEDVTIRDPDGVYRANDFFGGNFRGITSKLDYLLSLGVTALYLSPIFESSSNHRYDTADYMKLDKLLGTEKDFAELNKEAAERGISIVLDGVFNHTGADSVYFNKFGHYPSVGAYQSKDSPYYDWYTFYRYPDDYHCWWGVTVVPTIARDAQGFRSLIAGDGGVIEKWMKFGVKGWRLDVVDELPSTFVEEIRERIKSENPDGLVLGEVWEDASTKYSYGEERQYFFGEELDGVMNYVYKKAILDYVKDRDGVKFTETVLTIMENYPKESLDTCFTLIGTHDTVRALNVLSGADLSGKTKEERRAYRLSRGEYETGKKRLFLASALQYFLPGVPSVYYGDEIGMQGFEDPLNRRPFTWDRIDGEILAHYRYLGRLRAENRADFVSAAKISTDGLRVEIRRGKLVLTVDPEKTTFSITKED
jgi:glycosidase